MPASFKTLIRNLLLPVSVAGSCLSFQLSLPASEHTTDGRVGELSPSGSESGKSIRGFRSRDRSRPPVVREWNRSRTKSPSPSAAIPRTVPVAATAASPTESKIRFVSAGGTEDEKDVTSKDTETKPETPEISPRSDVPKESPPLSVKEQLLNALRMQREATAGSREPAAKPGTLTILHSPHTRADVVDSPDRVTNAVPAPPPPTPGQPSASDMNSAHPGSSMIPAPLNITAPEQNNSRMGLTRALDADLQSTDPFIRERAQRYLRLEMQLLKLRASQAAAAELPSADRESIPGEPTQSPQSEDAESTEPQDTEQPDSASPPQQDADATDDTDEQGDIASTSGTESNPVIKENVVVDGPIDRLGLANNLFAVGQFPLALEMYQQASADTLTSQQKFWAEYQTANCLRRLEKKGEASQRYRKLANQPEAGWLSQQAQWWVETLEKIRILESTLDDHTIDRHRATVEETEAGTADVESSQQQPASAQSVQKESQPDAIAQ